MKLRLLDDSIRLRLSRGDVETVSAQGVVEGQTRFPDGTRFTFGVEMARNDELIALCADNRIIVRLPVDEVLAWAGDDTAVSLHREIALPGGDSLKLLVEKDFQCLTPREGEDQSDMFPNPDASC